MNLFKSIHNKLLELFLSFYQEYHNTIKNILIQHHIPHNLFHFLSDILRCLFNRVSCSSKRYFYSNFFFLKFLYQTNAFFLKRIYCPVYILSLHIPQLAFHLKNNYLVNLEFTDFLYDIYIYIYILKIVQ